MHLVLCSASPRRRELLARVGLSFEVRAPAVDESRRAGEPVRDLPLRLAREKAWAGLSLARLVAPSDSSPWLALAADTVVSLGDQELGKPRDRAHARALLERLSGREHTVTTGVCVLGPGGAERSCAIDTKVRFTRLSAEQLDWLAASGEGDDKAGGYALQGLAGAFIERIEGSVTNVIGLPLLETLRLLEESGLRLPWSAPRQAQAGVAP